MIVYDGLHNVYLARHHGKDGYVLPTKPMSECCMEQGEDLKDAAMDTLHTCLGPVYC